MSTLSNNSFCVVIDAVNGSIVEIVHPQDPAGMSWVTSAKEMFRKTFINVVVNHEEGDGEKAKNCMQTA